MGVEEEEEMEEEATPFWPTMPGSVVWDLEGDSGGDSGFPDVMEGSDWRRSGLRRMDCSWWAHELLRARSSRLRGRMSIGMSSGGI